MTYTYFLTVVCNHTDDVDFVFSSLRKVYHKLKSIIIKGYGCVVKNQPNGKHENHPHAHVILKTKKPIKYSAVVSHVGKSAKLHFALLESEIDEERVENYILKHRGLTVRISTQGVERCHPLRVYRPSKLRRLPADCNHSNVFCESSPSERKPCLLPLAVSCRYSLHRREYIRLLPKPPPNTHLDGCGIEAKFLLSV